MKNPFVLIILLSFFYSYSISIIDGHLSHDMGILNCSSSGSILMERFDNISGNSINDLLSSPNYPDNPTVSDDLTSFEIPTDIGNDYGVRVRGYICAPETGTYYFWLAGDDDVELYLSTDDSPSNMALIVSPLSWTSSKQWDKYSSQKSIGINMIAGQRYYIEALMKEASYHDNMAVGWRLPSEGNSALPTEVVPGSVLSPFVVGTSDITSPTEPTLLSTGYGETTADLSWSGATDNVGVTNYKIFKDGALEATLGNVSSYQVTGLTASTSYRFTVTALDTANNESTVSNAVWVTTDTSSGGGGGSSAWSESGTTLSHTGEVAIGTSSVPSGYKLVVDGHIRTREIRVDLDSWPDYVFEEGYELPSLEEIEKHIHQYGHLPNIPSATEIKTNGVELGEMNKLLLEKIEELTLHTIEQQKTIHYLITEINLLKTKK